MLSEIWSIVLNTTWIDWFVMGLFGLIGTVIADKFGFFLWLDGLYSHSACIRRNTVTDINKSSLIEAIIEDLKFSIPRYKNFYEKYDFKKIVVNQIPHVDYALEILDLSNYLNKDEFFYDLKVVLSHKEQTKIIQYYSISFKLLSWLILARKLMCTHIESSAFLESYKLLAIPHKKQPSDIAGLITIDPIVDYKIYMQDYYIPKIKELKETAEELIRILDSKHSSQSSFKNN